jgi:hypothetical protein
VQYPHPFLFFQLLVINGVCAYLIYNLNWFSESGEMCAMKEVALFSDDAKSKESAKQLMQVT